MRLRAVTTALLIVTTLMSSAPQAGSAPATVRGPIGDAGLHGHALWDSWFDLGPAGYTEDEFFVSGTAKAHETNTTAPFTTRIIVTRPKDAKRFNGTVVLDWVNVTAQFENAVDTISAHEMMLRRGFAFVHVSAQSAGICCTPLTPKVWDPVRYADLNHPGDGYAFDIFTQVARVVRTSSVMGALRTRHVLATGQSQSASRLDTYVREVQPSAKAIDGFLIHGGGSRVFEPPPSVPVLHLQSELEADAEQPNTTKNYRLWEIAGAAHSDFWTGYHQVFGQGPRTLAQAEKEPYTADDEMHVVAGNYGEQPHPLHGVCTVAGASFPMRYAVNAAVYRLDRWVNTGKPAPSGPRFELDGSGMVARDEHGNGLGGVRLPPVEAPVATYVTTSCGLGGITVPFTTPQLLVLYPTHAGYLEQMEAATERSVRAGFLLPTDARDMLERACLAINRWDPSKTTCG